MNLQRLEWSCDARNEKSERAALRLGFSWEGTMRQHMVVKGETRDTKIFSLLRSEWRVMRETLEAWLAPENFGEDGVARHRLERIRDREVCAALSRWDARQERKR